MHAEHGKHEVRGDHERRKFPPRIAIESCFEKKEKKNEETMTQGQVLITKT